MKPPRVLALDTSRGACSVCVYDGALRAPLAWESLAMTRGHAEALAPMLKRVLDEAGGPEVVTKIAVAVGPGSFTGLRIGIATARAMALILGVPVVGVSTLIAYCGPMLDEPGSGVIAAAVDASHGHIYFQLIDSKAKPIFSPRVVSLRDAVRAIGGQSGAGRGRCGDAAGGGGAARRGGRRRQRRFGLSRHSGHRAHRPGGRSRSVAGAAALYQGAGRAAFARRRHCAHRAVTATPSKP